jgi:acyl dehydratase
MTPEQMYYENLAVGRVYRSASVEVTAAEITTFAARYDPQPFHLDPVAAQASVFGGLVASGWLTASLTMRLMVNSEFKFGRGVVGLGVESLRWPLPVRPGDTLTAAVEIAAMRTSESKPDHGVVKIRTTTTNQRGEVVQVLVSNVLVPRRPVAPAPSSP